MGAISIYVKYRDENSLKYANFTNISHPWITEQITSGKFHFIFTHYIES
jgi:hypothetical protein